MTTKAPPKSKRTEKEIASLDIPQAAIEQPEDGTVGKIITDHIKVTLTGLIITGDLTYEDWLKAAEFYQFLRSRTQWIIGDMLRYGESRYGEKYAQAVDEHGKSASRLQTYVYVCGRFEIERRRPELGFDHHAECASLDPREADRVLLEAIKLRWSATDVRAEVDRINERNGTPRRGRKPKNLPNSAKSDSPTLDGHVELELHKAEKPAIWNGYPLRVMIMPDGTRVILQKDEPLPTDEADRAAHENGHAHGPNLAKWLEEHNFIKGGDEPCAQNTPPSCSPIAQESIEGASVPIVSASNGAAPNATESAPTPQLLPCPFCGGEVCRDFVNDEHHRNISCAQCGESFRMSDETWNSRPTAAPAAPPASPEPPNWSKAIGERDMAIHSLGREKDQLQAQLDDARDQLKRYDAHTAAATPLQRAEEAILAFNKASEEVDWKAVGQDKLLRSKWLSRLLARADIVIDLVQNNPPAPRSEKP